jgi:signal transduction histidine kinase
MEEDLELLAPHLEVKTEIAPQLRVQGDRDLLTQVLQNLISNAIKYNFPNGWIQIYTRQQQASVLVTITNSSKNIPLSDQERIFERFHRGDPARTRKVEGTGLGLSLSREITRAHGGDLTLDSTLSNQTAFTLTLPLESKPS